MSFSYEIQTLLIKSYIYYIIFLKAKLGKMSYMHAKIQFQKHFPRFSAKIYYISDIKPNYELYRITTALIRSKHSWLHELKC